MPIKYIEYVVGSLMFFAIVSFLVMVFAPIAIVAGILAVPVLLTWGAIRWSRRIEDEALYQRVMIPYQEAVKNESASRAHHDYYKSLLDSYDGQLEREQHRELVDLCTYYDELAHHYARQQSTATLAGFDKMIAARTRRGSRQTDH